MWLRLRQFGVAQCVFAQAVDQIVGRAGIEEAQVIGEKAVVIRAITRQMVRHRLDIILALTPSAVQIPIKRFRRRFGQRRHHKARVVAQAHDLGLEHHPVRGGPGASPVIHLVVKPGRGRCTLLLPAGVLAALPVHGAHRAACNRRKTQLGLGKLHPRRSGLSFVRSVIDVTPIILMG